MTPLRHVVATLALAAVALGAPGTGDILTPEGAGPVPSVIQPGGEPPG